MIQRELRPILLIGAARSGTKIMRDCLAEATGIPAVPYDVGYIWRYGNESAPDDQISATKAGENTREMVTRFIGKYADDRGYVIEKTVGNTLRVPYVKEILPTAVFVHLVRDGVDVVESARREWRRPVNLRYLARKSGHFPPRLLPSYGRKFLVSNVLGRRSAGHVGTWGPRYAGIDADLERVGLLAVTARQWRACVEMARHDLPRDGSVVHVRYEEFVADPVSTLRRVAQAIDVPVLPGSLLTAAAKVRSGSKGQGRATLTPAELSLLAAEIGDLLEELDYERP